MRLWTVVHGPGPDQHPGKWQGAEQVKRNGPAKPFAEETGQVEVDDAAERAAGVDDSGDDTLGLNSMCLPVCGNFGIGTNLMPSSFSPGLTLHLARG